MCGKHRDIALVGGISLAGIAMMVVIVMAAPVKEYPRKADEVQIVYHPDLYRRETQQATAETVGQTNVAHRFFWEVAIGGEESINNVEITSYENGKPGVSVSGRFRGVIGVGISLMETVADTEAGDAAPKWPRMTKRQTMRKGESLVLLVKEEGVPAWLSGFELPLVGGVTRKDIPSLPDQMARMEFSVRVDDYAGWQKEVDTLVRLDFVTGPTGNVPDPQ